MTSWFARYSNLIWFIISLKFSILISLLRQVVMAAVTHEHGVNFASWALICAAGSRHRDTDFLAAGHSYIAARGDGAFIVSQRNCRM